MYIEKEWTKLKNQLNSISFKTSRGLPKNTTSNANINSHPVNKVKPLYYDVTEGKIRSEKNSQAIGDIGNLDERNSDGSDTKASINPINKPHIKQTKPSALKKTNSDNTNELIINSGRKKTMSQYTATATTNTFAEKTRKYAPRVNTELIVSSNDSDIAGAHKKPRQPKQRVGNSSKVSSSEKEPHKAKEKGNFISDILVLIAQNQIDSDEEDEF